MFWNRMCECALSTSMYVLAYKTGRYDRFVCDVTLSVTIFQSNETGRIEEYNSYWHIQLGSYYLCLCCAAETKLKCKLESNQMVFFIWSQCKQWIFALKISEQDSSWKQNQSLYVSGFCLIFGFILCADSFQIGFSLT